MTTPAQRRRAKLLYRLSGLLSHVKTPQRVFTVETVDDRPDGAYAGMTPAGRRWLPCRPANRLFARAMRLDWDHFEHWAADHSRCHALRCPECGGLRCTRE